MLINFIVWLFKIVVEIVAISFLTLLYHHFLGGELIICFGIALIAILIIHYGEELSSK